VELLERPKRTLSPTPNLAGAKVDYLYGVNGKPPTRTIKGLCEAHNTSAKTVRKWIKEWDKDLLTIATNRPDRVSENTLSGNAFKLALTSEVNEKNSARIAILDKELDSLAFELENCEPAIRELSSFLHKFEDGEKDYALRIFENYLRASLNKQNLRKQFMAMHSQWTKVCGIDSIVSIQETGAKVIASLTAKASMGDSDKTDAETESVGIGFKRRG